MARRKKGLGSPLRKHHAGAQAALVQAKRFMDAAERSLKRGRCESAVQNAMHAREFATQAVAEAAHGRPRKGKGPTLTQSKASYTADEAIHLWRRISKRCVRR